MPYLIADGDLDPPMSRRDSSHVADERCSIAFQTAFDRPLAPPLTAACARWCRPVCPTFRRPTIRLFSRSSRTHRLGENRT